MATRTVVFDMDGTLVQTRAASWDVFQDTARKFGLPVRSAEEFFELFRGNFYQSLETLCGDPAVEGAVREHFLKGLRDRYAPRFIPGMADVVKTLATHYPLAVMSSNAMEAIRRILEAEGVAQCFAHVFSGELGSSKEAHLRQILNEPSYGSPRRCSPNYVEDEELTGSDVVLITDTVGDVREARSCGVRAIGVAWGMHGIDALFEAGAESVALWPQELLATLLPAWTCSDGSDTPACRCAEVGACQMPPQPAALPSRGQRKEAPRAPILHAERAWPWPLALQTAAIRRQRRSVDPRDLPKHLKPVSGTTAGRAGTTVPFSDPVLAAALSRISGTPP